MLYGALAFAVAVAFVPGFEGGATTPRWALIAFTVPWLLRDRLRFGVADLAAGLLLGWSGLTILWSSPARLDGIGELLTLVLLLSCFLFGRQISDMRPVWIGAGLGVSVSSLIAVIQAFGWHIVQTNERSPIAGLFANGNFLAEAAAPMLVAAVIEEIWWLVPLLLPGLLLPTARGAALAATVPLLVYAFKRPGQRWKFAALLCVLGGALLYLAATRTSESAIIRLTTWRAALEHLTLVGQGLGWGSIVLPEYLHNEFLNVAFETGLIGFALLGLFCLTLLGPMNAARYVLIAFAVEASFEYPLHLPVTGFLAMVAAGHAVRSRFVLWGFDPFRRGTSEDRMAEAIGDYPHLGGPTVSVRSSLPTVSGRVRGKAA